MQQLQDAVEALGDETRRRAITLTASIGVTGLWLLPRLGRLQARHPDIELRIAAQNRLVDIEREDVDLAIRYCSRKAAPEGAIHLFDEALAPVAHPSLASASLADQVLLEFDDPGRPWLRWDAWLKRHAPDVTPRGILRFNQYDQVAHSAMAGQGIALGRTPLLDAMLGDGRLVMLSAPEAPHDNDHGYWLLSTDNGDATRAVVEWLVAEANPSR
ncbi:MAG: HTH-type transcriptional regulator DsdC [Luteibacter sp.]|uniref:LysR substrate-binding domain-containing protein n=1 Tax=Luteibacter sp. TaxID=1886636 RepID=UPI00137F54A8|nr:LysR substrate-binding domain-containing protein [Luteibacter sp.]KAF1006625.1 MAG: HTH-type transcriptional regulator DsdC [Luteibacter sp.]